MAVATNMSRDREESAKNKSTIEGSKVKGDNPNITSVSHTFNSSLNMFKIN